MHLYYTGEDGGNPYVSFTKDDRVIGKTIARFDDIVARIERQDYRILKSSDADKRQFRALLSIGTLKCFINDQQVRGYVFDEFLCCA